MYFSVRDVSKKHVEALDVLKWLDLILRCELDP